jgi:sulfur transfer complex TusBCD TusB component (DsrH family)
MTDLFLLTKPPGSTRAELCFKLMERSSDPVIYLFGDGVFHLLSPAEIPADRVIICKEDASARGVPAGACAYGQDEFYDRLVHEMMETADHVYTF